MTRRRMLLRAAVSFVFTGWLAAVSSSPAVAQEASALHIRGVAQAADGTTKVVVALSGEAAGARPSASAFSIVENGTALGATKVEPYVGSRQRPIAVAIVMDVSGSMRGRALADAKAAATAFLGTLPDAVLTGLVTFDSRARLAVGFTADHARIRSAIADLTAAGETALYDATVLAVRELSKVEAQANVVVLSDGADTTSSATLEAARRSAREANAAITAVALETADLDTRALTSLAGETGGSFLPVARSADLTGAFGRAATELTSQVVVTYKGADAQAAELDIEVMLSVAGARISDGAVVLNERKVDGSPVSAPVDTGPAPTAVLIIAIVLLGLAATALLAVTLGRTRQNEELALGRAVTFYSRSTRGDDDDSDERSVSLDLREGLRAIVGRLPKPKGYEAAVDAKLERAAWPLRASEFLAIRAGCAFAAVVLLWLATQEPLLALTGAVPGWLLPRFVLDQRVHKRNAMFNEQLPDTLQMLAASLEAGYGVLQGLESIVREARSPTSEEFARTLAEIRLGVPVHDALESMSDRIGGEDFRWIVMSMNIQREVGGNLVQILRTVSETIRERAQLHRTIKTLSAEGRLSAVILAVLPFGIAVYIAFVNPTYIATLFGSLVGRLLIAGSIVLMGVGGMWLRKLIRIEV